MTEAPPAHRGPEEVPPTYSELRARRRTFRDLQDDDADEERRYLDELWREAERECLG